MKNFATKLPLYADKLGVSEEELAEVKKTYAEMRAAKAKEDQERLKLVEEKLRVVPSGWPPPSALHDLMRKIPSIEEPLRTRMLEEIERWCVAITQAGAPILAPKLDGAYFDKGIVVRVTLPEPCRWSRIYYRKTGEAAWQLLAITAQNYHLHTDPESQEEEEEKLSGNLEFLVLGLLPHEDPQRGFSHAYGAPSEVLTMAVPTEYPVPADLIGKPVSGE